MITGQLQKEEQIWTGNKFEKKRKDDSTVTVMRRDGLMNCP
jgi:hypothetical protein